MYIMPFICIKQAMWCLQDVEAETLVVDTATTTLEGAEMDSEMDLEVAIAILATLTANTVLVFTMCCLYEQFI